MTFKDLQKLVQSQSSPEQSQLLQRLKDKPFWIWDQDSHRKEDMKTKGDCCFNHIIGYELPTAGKIANTVSGNKADNKIKQGLEQAAQTVKRKLES